MKMKRCILAAFFLVILTYAYGQQQVKGVVLDASTNQPVSSASIFLNNTSIGTKSDVQGRFELVVPKGKFDLIVSSIGYQSFNQTIYSGDTIAHFRILLRQKATEMETIIIEPFIKDGWKIFGKFFLENFIGTSTYASGCVLKNPEVLRFRHSKTTNELSVIALEPLRIENSSLGYTIHYQMESFVYDFKSRYLFFTGYPFFEPMKGGEGKQKRWMKNRREVYYGSQMHFMRSVYLNRLKEEGFEVRRLQKIPNLEKQRVKATYDSIKKHNRTPGGIFISSSIIQDSAAYYEKILEQEDFFELIGKDLLTGDSIAYALEPTIAGMDFPDFLLVIFKNKLADPEYIRLFPESSTAMMSQIFLINGNPLEVYGNGSYYHPEDLLNQGYWAWFEKLATMLPYDYKP